MGTCRSHAFSLEADQRAGQMPIRVRLQDCLPQSAGLGSRLGILRAFSPVKSTPLPVQLHGLCLLSCIGLLRTSSYSPFPGGTEHPASRGARTLQEGRPEEMPPRALCRLWCSTDTRRVLWEVRPLCCGCPAWHPGRAPLSMLPAKCRPT